jgi:hypothetical protein
MLWCFKLTIGWLSDQMHNKNFNKENILFMFNKIVEGAIYFYSNFFWHFLDFKTQITKIEF